MTNTSVLQSTYSGLRSGCLGSKDSTEAGASTARMHEQLFSDTHRMFVVVEHHVKHSPCPSSDAFASISVSQMKDCVVALNIQEQSALLCCIFRLRWLAVCCVSCGEPSCRQLVDRAEVHPGKGLLPGLSYAWRTR